MKKRNDKVQNNNSSEKTYSDNFAPIDFECDQINRSVIFDEGMIRKGKGQSERNSINTIDSLLHTTVLNKTSVDPEQDSISETEPFLQTIVLNKEIADEVLCITVTTDNPHNLVDPQILREMSQIVLIHSYEDLQNCVPNEPMDFLYFMDVLHTIKNEDYYDSIHRKNTYNYLSAKAPEYFGYLDDVFVNKKLLDEISRSNRIAENKELWEKKKAEAFWDFVKAGEKILPDNVKPTDIADKSEIIICFSPKHMIVPNIKINIQDMKYRDIWDSYNLIAEDQSGFLKFQAPNTQPKQKRMSSSNFNDYNIDEMSVTINTASFHHVDWEQYLQKLHDDHFHKVRSLVPPSSTDIVVKKAVRAQSEKEAMSANDVRTTQIFASIKRDMGDIPQIRANKTSLERATRISLLELIKNFPRSEISDEGALTTSDVAETRNGLGIRTNPHYKPQDGVIAYGVSPYTSEGRFSVGLTQFSDMSFGEYSETKTYTENMFGKSFAEIYFTSGRTIDDIDENFLRNKTAPYNGDSNLQSNIQFSKEKNNLEIDFSNKDSVTVDVNIPMSLIGGNLDEDNVKMFLNDFRCTVIREFEKRKSSSFSVQNEFAADTHENGMKSTSELQGKESDVLTTTNITIDKKTLRVDKKHCTEVPNTDHNSSESKISLSPRRQQEIEVHFTFHKSNKEPAVEKGISSNRNVSKTKTLRNQKQAFNAQNLKQKQKLDGSFRQSDENYTNDSSSWEETVSFKLWKDRQFYRIRQSKYSSRKDKGVEIIEGEYPTEDRYDKIQRIKTKKQPKYSAENNVYQRFDSNTYQANNFETEERKLLFNGQLNPASNLKGFGIGPSNYSHVQQNGIEIMNIASENMEKIKQEIKRNKIRPICANTDEIIIKDAAEDKIKIIDEKMSKPNI